MKNFLPCSFHRAWRYPFAVLAILALHGAGVAPAQIISTGGGCVTSRAQEDLERVHAALYAWYLDVVSGIASATPVDRRASAGTPLCPGSPPVDVTQVPPIAVEELRALLVPQYIAAIPDSDPWERQKWALVRSMRRRASR